MGKLTDHNSVRNYIFAVQAVICMYMVIGPHNIETCFSQQLKHVRVGESVYVCVMIYT